MSISRRKALIDLAARYQVPVLEDDAYGLLHFGDPPPPALAALDKSGAVICLGSMSKVLCSGLHFGWMAVPPVVKAGNPAMVPGTEEPGRENRQKPPGPGGIMAAARELTVEKEISEGWESELLQAVLFDLDGTLLRVDTAEFMTEYLREVGRAVSPVVDPGRFIDALLASTEAMRANRDPSVTNAQAFWADFRPRLKDCIDALEPVILDFYTNKFNRLSRVAQPCPGAREAVEAALDRGLRVVLATNPVFPLSAIRDRMAWAGVEDLPWEFVTSYEEMHFCKPHPEYYLEVADRLGVPAEKCLMVGNDPGEDLAASGVGMRTYLVTDHLKDSGQVEFNPDLVGSLADLTDWLIGAGPDLL